MGCQKNIARQVVQGGADYLLAVKANQGELHENIQDLFACCEREGWDGVAHSRHEQVGKDHGRLESRQCRVITDPEELAYVDPHRQWDSLGAVARVSYWRDADANSPTDTRYYICSYPADAARLLAATRSHWSIENSLHWVLDVAFDEDHSPGENGPRRPEPGGDTTPGTEPAEAGTQRENWHQGQTQKEPAPGD